MNISHSHWAVTALFTKEDPTWPDPGGEVKITEEP